MTRFVFVCSVLLALGLVVYLGQGPGDTVLSAGVSGVPAVKGDGIEATKATPTRPRKGPELEKWYFSRWNEPYSNLLPTELMEEIWSEIRSLPSENDPGMLPVNSWEMMGPFGMDVDGGAKYTGRILDIEVENGASTRLAAASGGLWGFVLIFPVPLTEELSSQAIGTFRTDPTNSNVIYVGTGEPYQRTGTGMWKTTNGGTSWAQVPLSPTPGGFYRIRFAPGSPSIIHAVTTAGYYRSTNSGSSFTRLRTGDISDIAINPTNNQIIYIGVWTDGVYKSTDGGGSFTKLTTGGIPTTNVGRVALTLCNASPNTVYASIAANDDNTLLGVYKTTNGGTSWTNVSPPVNFLGGQGWYDNVIGVSPINPNIVFAGGVTLYKTTNGGASWTEVADVNMHVDHHAITWNSTGTSVWIGNDGGMSFSNDGGNTWSTAGNLVPITQYVNIHVGVNNARVMGGGSQDNSISLTTNGGTNWRFRIGGDGGGVSIDPSNANRIFVTNGVYGGSWAFRRLKSTDMGQTWSFIDTGIDPSGQWYHEIRNDQVSPIWLYHNSGTFVYQSTNDGANWTKTNTTGFPVEVARLRVSRWTSPTAVLYAALASSTTGQRLRVYDAGSWSERSTGLATGLSVRGVTPHITNTSIAYALMNGFTAGSKVYKTTNRGQTWTNISGNLPNVACGDILPHPTNDNLLYLGTQMGCYRTTNGGTSWHRWNNGMPEANIVTEMSYIDSIAVNGRFYVVAGTYGRGMWKREISGDDPVDVPAYAEVPRSYALEQNFPNPFNPTTTIRYALPSSDRVELKIHDILGREVATLVDGVEEAGEHVVHFDARGLASGAYFYTIRTPKFTQTRKMLLTK